MVPKCGATSQPNSANVSAITICTKNHSEAPPDERRTTTAPAKDAEASTTSAGVSAPTANENTAAQP